MRKIISIVLSFGLLFQQSGILYAAGEINLANYLSQARSVIAQPDQFRPAQLRYISYDIKSNDFKLLLDKGDVFNQKTEKPKNEKTLEFLNSPNSSTPKLNDATQELFNYFLIGLSLPNDTFWVNLRPDAPENIIDPLLEKTDIGKIFLEADLQLKKDTASLTSPQNPEGKSYWDKLYKKAGELFGTENITIPTITRPWIVPNEVIVRETEDSAYIYKATLKVMLEADYLNDRGGLRTAPTPDQYAFSDPRLKELNEYSSQIIRETIIPKLTKEVNSSKRYAQLRQVYYSLVLARWFKQKYSGLGSIRAPEHQSTGSSANSYIGLIDSGNLVNLASPEPCDKQTYFQAYQKSFKDGEYNLKETVPTPFGQSIRSYISGGLHMKFGAIGADSPITGIRVPNRTEVTETLTGHANSPLNHNKIKELADIVGKTILKYKNEFERIFKSLSVQDKQSLDDIDKLLNDNGQNYLQSLRSAAIKLSGMFFNRFTNQDPNSIFRKEAEEIEDGYLTIKRAEGAIDFLIKEAGVGSPITAKQFEMIVQHISASSDSFEVKAASIVKYLLTLKSGEEKKSIYSGNIREIFGKFINLGGFRGGDATINYIMEFIESKLRANKEYLSDQWNNEVFASVIFHSNSKENNEQIEISKRLQEALNAKSLEDAEAIVEKLIKKYPGSKVAFSDNTYKNILAKIIPIEMLLSLFMKYDEQQEILGNTVEDVIKDAHASIVGTDKIRLDGLRDPEKVGIGVERIMKKIFKAVQEAKSQNIPPEITSDESLKLAQEVFIITSQKDKTYRYRELIGAHIIGVFEEFLKNKSGGVNVKDMKTEIEAAFSGYIRENVVGFLITFIRNNINNPYGKFIGEGQALHRLIGELKEEAQEEVLGQTHYSVKKLLSIINKLSKLSEDTRLETAEENLLLIQEVTAAGSPLTEKEFQALLKDIRKKILQNINQFNKERNEESCKLVPWGDNGVYVIKENSASGDGPGFITFTTVDEGMLIYDRSNENFFMSRVIVPGVYSILPKIRYPMMMSCITIKYENYRGIGLETIKRHQEKSSSYENDLSDELESAYYDMVRNKNVPRDEYDGVIKKVLREIIITSDLDKELTKSDLDKILTMFRIIIERNESKGYNELEILNNVFAKLKTFVPKGENATTNKIKSSQLMSAIQKVFWEYKSAAINELSENEELKPVRIGVAQEQFSALTRIERGPTYDEDYTYGKFIEITEKILALFVREKDISKDTVDAINMIKTHMRNMEFINEVISPTPSVSSAIASVPVSNTVKRGGIDLTDRMLKIKLERVGSFASSALVLPEINNVEALNLDKEFEQIQAMVSSSIRPSDTRILEFAAACYYRGEFDQRLAQVNSCIKSAHLADEVSGRDSSEALRLATMLPDALYGG